MTAMPADSEPVPARVRPGGGLTLERLFMFVSPAALILFWELASDAGLIDRRVFSSPHEVVGLTIGMIADGSLWLNLRATLLRFALGCLAGIIPGTLIGVTMGLFRWPRAVLNPLVAAIYPLPRIALFPLVLLIVGLNETSNILMIALQPFFYMLIGSLGAVLNVDPIYLRVARSFKTGTYDLYRLVVIPAALPIIVSSLRIALGGAFLVTIAVESLVANDGIGFLIWHSWTILTLGQAMVGLFVAGLIGFAMLQGLDAVEKRLVPWAPGARAGRR